MTDKDTLLNRRKKMGWAGWMPYDERSKNDFKCKVVDWKGEAQNDGLEMIQKHFEEAAKKVAQTQQNVTDRKMQGKHWQRSLLTGGAAARSPDPS